MKTLPWTLSRLSISLSLLFIIAGIASMILFHMDPWWPPSSFPLTPYWATFFLIVFGLLFHSTFAAKLFPALAILWIFWGLVGCFGLSLILGELVINALETGFPVIDNIQQIEKGGAPLRIVSFWQRLLVFFLLYLFPSLVLLYYPRELKIPAQKKRINQNLI